MSDTVSRLTPLTVSVTLCDPRCFVTGQEVNSGDVYLLAAVPTRIPCGNEKSLLGGTLTQAGSLPAVKVSLG